MSLPYESIVAEPDDESLFACLRKKNADRTAGIVSAAQKATVWKSFKRRWEAASKAFKKHEDDRMMQTHTHDFDMEYTGIDGIRMCARNQQLKVDPSALTKRLLEIVSQLCKNATSRAGIESNR